MTVNDVRSSTASFPSLVRQNKSGHVPHSAAEQETQNAAQPPREDLLTAEEKKYFAGLFPQAAGDIQAYQVYSPAGKRTMTQSGTLVDRRG